MSPAAYPFTARNPSIEQLWFAGTRSDVGGGRPESDGALWRTSFEWIVTEAERKGLQVNQDQVNRMLVRGTARPPWAEPANESLLGVWWAAVFFPKLSYSSTRHRKVPSLGCGRPRKRRGSEMLHASVAERLCNSDYDPPWLPADFRATLECPPPSSPKQYMPVATREAHTRSSA